ncbi:hypothetical protein [Sphingomonas cavernae]|uniref:Right-handed parallel beta-helix repeat-containing protein n=1 Tax=Sphingomonas cavernae TaxID=2320861 RepID=A0A418WPV1_9SPHN|nr:hypothetical protein [Sphingomonas cavernae]RJF93260.1 hypothetical protein D3876_02585 [Sphingomonas cavernae]
MAYPLSRRRLLAAAGALPFGSLALGSAKAADKTVVDGRVFNGARALVGSGADGGTALVAKTNMTVRNCQFHNWGNGAIRAWHSTTEHFVIEDCSGSNVYRFLENWSWNHRGGTPAPLSDFTLRRISIVDAERGLMRLRYASQRGLIEDAVAFGSADCANYCTGFALLDQVSDITYRRCEAHRFIESRRPQDRYWNGDGFSDERGNARIRYEGCVATDSSDGGFDTKSDQVYLVDCRARGNKRNYRMWNTGMLQRCRSEEPVRRGGTGRAAHFSFHGGSGARYVIDRPFVRATAGNAAPVFLFENDAPAVIDIFNADIHAPAAPLIVVTGAEPVINWYPARPQQNIRVGSERG